MHCAVVISGDTPFSVIDFVTVTALYEPAQTLIVLPGAEAVIAC